MRKYIINANLVRAIVHLYDNAISSVQFIWRAAQENGSEHKLGSGKDVIFHPSSSIFYSKGLSDALEEHCGKASIGGKI